MRYVPFRIPELPGMSGLLLRVIVGVCCIRVFVQVRAKINHSNTSKSCCKYQIGYYLVTLVNQCVDICLCLYRTF